MSVVVKGTVQPVGLPPAGLSGAQLADNSDAPQNGAAGSAAPVGDGAEPAADAAGQPPAAATSPVDAAVQPETPPVGVTASGQPEMS